jgi:thiamine pyrophosphate-dependent acetolactate synthase large subunit-like protein
MFASIGKHGNTTAGVLPIPTDVQEEEMDEAEPSPRNVMHHASFAPASGVRLPHIEDLNRAVEILRDGRKIAILAGRGALDAREELLQTADLLGAPIVKALLGKAVVPDDHPLTTGGIGLLGTRPSQEAFE